MTADSVGGIWTYALELARSLGRHGVEVVLATMGRPLDDDQRAAARVLGNLELHESSFKLEWMIDPWADVVAAGEWLLELAERTRPSLVHLNGYAHAALPWHRPTLVVGHSCVYSWFAAVKGCAPSAGWRPYHEAVRRGLEAASLVTAPSHDMLEALQRHYGRFHVGPVVYNGRSPTLAPSRKRPAILAVGRLWDEAKNLVLLDEVAPRLPWPVHVAGEAEHPDGGRVRFSGLRLLGRLGEQELARWLEAAIFALPARYEPFGLSALEAGLAGCALVLGDIPSLREVWGDAALFVSPDQPAQLEAALRRVIEDEEARERLARRARRRARGYSSERSALGYLSIYAGLAAREGSRELDRPLAARRAAHRAEGGEGRAVSAGAGAGRAGDPGPRLPDRCGTGQPPLRFAFFYHSLLSDWNHGNAHFLRGVCSELEERGHEVVVYEPRDSWSLQHLLAEHGEEPLRELRRVYPRLRSVRYDLGALDLHAALDGVDVVIVHEWSDRGLVRRLGEHRRACGGYLLLFHDTHHRSVTGPEEMASYDLSGFDALLAYGEVIRRLYLRRGWIGRAFTWHEAADTRIFRPRPAVERAGDLVWIGNWGDDERSSELEEFLLGPVRALGLRARVHGVRYPDEARERLVRAGIEAAGWLPNFRVPEVFGGFRVTVHIPRRPYVVALPGIPTIRPFEALACGIPLVSAPWHDVEHLFTPGEDYLVAHDGAEMTRHLRSLLADPARAQALAEHGLRTVQARHTCAHRVDELLEICAELALHRGASAGGEQGEFALHRGASAGGEQGNLRAGEPAARTRASGRRG